MQDEETRRRVAERLAYGERVGFHETCGMRTVSWGDGRARVELDVTPALENPNGVLHGGAIATLIDHAGTVAVMSADRQARPGVTTDLNVTFLSPAAGGSTVYADAVALKCGKTLAFATVDVRRVADDALVAQGRMTKFQGA